MEERLTIARPYALAAFETAQERGELALWSGALKLLAAVLDDPDMRRLVRDPRVADSQIIDLIKDLGTEQFNQPLQNLIELLVSTERIGLAPEIAKLFEKHRADAEGSLAIVVVSAYPLAQRQQDVITQAVKQRSGRNIEITCQTDRDLIGGAVIRAEDTVIDLSVRGRLNSLSAGLD